MKSTNYYFLFLSLLVGFLTLDYFLNKKLIHLKNRQFPVASTHVQAISVQTQLKAETVKNSTTEESSLDSIQQFKSEFKYEVARIGQIQTDSDTVENRLQALARQMEPEHRKFLELILMSDKKSGDERAMAIELLSRSQTPESAEILKNYTLSDSASGSFKSDQELVFKAQAIEGLSGYQDRNVALSYLNEISRKTNYSFLQDRVHRAQSALNNDDPTIETKAFESLKKTIK